MLCEVPLTKEQQTFATAHHSLVYKFLNENRLPEDEFYDVVIFGYLKAVRDYFSDLTAQQFTFSTIANRRMKFCLFDYFRTQERRKRNMEVLSIHVGLYPDGAPLEDTIPAHDPIMQQLEMDLLLHELAGRVSKQQMDIVHMKQILIVEDDSFLNKMLAYNLTADGYGVTSALNARTAADAIRQRKFDLVLLDINLPDGNGLSCAS